MKKVKFFIIALFAIVSLNAQSSLGKIFFDIKDYELAKKYFQQKLSDNPGEANYYLGEIAFAEGDLEAAANFFNKGLPTNEAYCKIGLAKIELKKGNKADALSTYLQLTKKYSGDVNILAAFGYAYLDNKSYQDVQTVLNDMQKAKKNDPSIYILEGDMLKAQDKIGEATPKYEMAILFNPKFELAYIKLAEAYENSSWQTAVEYLNNLLEQNPDYILAHRYLGRIYSSAKIGQWQKAIDAYKIFFAAGNYTLDDIGRYAQALFFQAFFSDNNYEEAYAKISEGLAIAPNHFTLNRFRMYVAARTQNIESGLKYAEHFFSLKGDYIVRDYTMYAQLLKEAKMYDEAIEQYKKALLMDATTVDMYKEMATIAALKGQNGMAGDYLKLYDQKRGAKKADIMDYFNMGRYYYIAANVRNANDTATLLSRYKDIDFVKTISENELQKDSILTNEQLFIEKALKYYMNQADKAYDAVIELNPDSYQGYLWKARVNALIDPDTELGLAKPHYEKVIEVLADREDKNQTMTSSLVEAYRFLAWYYYKNKDFPNTKLNSEKVLEFDPEETTAKTLLDELKKHKF